MSAHSRPVDRAPKSRSKKTQSKAVKSSTFTSRTAINPAQAWPFPCEEAKRAAEQATLDAAKPKGLRYLDAKGVVRVYSRKARHADQTRK